MAEDRRKSVVITGASSGIGRASVAQMVAHGWQVFATVRKPADGEKLRADFPQNVAPIILDVRDRAAISAAAAAVSSQLDGRGLDGLVNVAGVGVIRPVEYVSAEDMRNIFEINVFGQVEVSEAFLPSIRKAKGRIVNISSVGAHFGIPFGGLLNGSKGAFGLLSDAMRLELRPFGIAVSTIEPASIRTPAVDKTLGDVEGVIRRLPARGAEEYGGMLREANKRAYEKEMKGSSPDVVARAVHHALTADRPRARYRVGKGSLLLSILPVILPDRLLDGLLLRIFGLPTKFGALSAD